jgi:hypothetical protein
VGEDESTKFSCARVVWSNEQELGLPSAAQDGENIVVFYRPHLVAVRHERSRGVTDRCFRSLCVGQHTVLLVEQLATDVRASFVLTLWPEVMPGDPLASRAADTADQPFTLRGPRCKWQPTLPLPSTAARPIRPLRQHLPAFPFKQGLPSRPPRSRRVRSLFATDWRFRSALAALQKRGRSLGR